MTEQSSPTPDQPPASAAPMAAEPTTLADPLRQTMPLLLLLAAAALTAVATFLPLFFGVIPLQNGSAFTLNVTGWGLSSSSDMGGAGAGNPFGPFSSNGYPLAVAVVLLLLGAGLVYLRANLGPRRLDLPKAGAVASAAFLTALAISVGTQGIGWSALFSQGSEGAGASAGVGIGFWLLVIATVASLTAAVAVLLPAKEQAAVPEAPVAVHDASTPRTDVSTPRLGFPVQDPNAPNQ